MKVFERVDKGSKNIDNYNIKNKGGGVTLVFFFGPWDLKCAPWTICTSCGTIIYLLILPSVKSLAIRFNLSLAHGCFSSIISHCPRIL